jgi:hypothetical protein
MRYEIWMTQGQGEMLVEFADSMEQAVDWVSKHKDEGSFAIKYPSDEWHVWWSK